MKLQTLRQNKKKKYSYKCWNKFILIFTLAFALCPSSFAKKGSSWRKLLNPFHLNLSIGNGINSYKNLIWGMYMYEQDGNHYLALPANQPYIRYLVRGISQPYIRLKTYEPITINGLNNQPNGGIKYTGQGPISLYSLSIHVDILKKLRIELGSSLLINYISTLQADKNNAPLGNLKDALGRYYKIRHFSRLGFKLYENQTYTLLFNAQNSYDLGYSNLADELAIYHPFFATIAIGFTGEKHISEYVTTFACFMYEIGKSLNTVVPKKGFAVLSQQSFYLQFGMHFNCPEIPQCPLKHCKIASKHQHNSKPYLGQSMFKREKEPK